MKKLNCFAVVVSIALWILTQSTVANCEPYTAHQFISTAVSDPAVTGIRGIKEFSKDARNDTPFIQRIELRGGVESTEDDDETEQDYNYRLRFYPRPWGDTKYSRQLTTIKYEAYEIEQDRYLGRALRQRYTLVLEYIRCAQQLKLKRSLEKVYADRTFVLQKKLSTRAGADVGALISSENKHIALRLEIEELENQIAGLADAIYKMAGSKTDIAFSEDELIGMSQIKNIISKTSAAAADKNIDLARQNHEVSLADAAFELEKAKSHDYLRFFEVGRSMDDRDKESISFEVGLRVPFIGTYRKSIWERQVALKQEKFAYEKAKTVITDQIIQSQRRLELLVSQHEILTKGNKKGSTIKAVRSYIRSRGGDPLELLKLNESLLEDDIRLSEAAHSARSAFIEFLDLTGQLTQKPLIDYLSKQLNELI